MTVLTRSIYTLFVVTALSSTAHAHFKMLQPASWLNEDSVGGPQKGSPCGPGNTGALGDDVQPVPESKKVTEVHAGDTVMVELQETVFHPGYFRIALAADRKDLKIPPVDDPNSCSVDLSKIPTGAHDNVLMDGLWKEESMGGSNRHLMQEVKLPDTPCENCTLQVIQVMKDHGLSSCYYYHCANLKIMPAAGASTGSAGTSAAGASGSAGTSGSSAAAAGSSAKAGSGAAAGSGGVVAAASGGETAAAGAKATTSTAAAGSSATTATTTTTASTGAAGKPAASSTTGASSTTTTAKAGSGAPATGTTTSPSTSSDSATGATSSGSSGGCAVSGAEADANGASFALLSLLGLFWAGRRKRA